MKPFEQHENMKLIQINHEDPCELSANTYTRVIEMIEEDENYIVYTTCTLIDKKSTHGKNFLKDTYIKQDSPVKRILQQIDQYNHKCIKEDKHFELLYELPESLKEELNVNPQSIIEHYKNNLK